MLIYHCECPIYMYQHIMPTSGMLFQCNSTVIFQQGVLVRYKAGIIISSNTSLFQPSCSKQNKTKYAHLMLTNNHSLIHLYLQAVPSWSWSYGSWIYHYLCHQCLLPLKSNSVYGEVYLIQHNVIEFVNDLRQVGGFIRVLRFPPLIQLTATV